MEYKNDVHKPLVYIDQPTIRKPEATMQHYYKSIPDEQSAEADNNVRPKSQRLKQRPYMQAQNVWDEQDDNERESPKEKNFSMLSIREKINYLLKRPQFIPTLTCQIQTTEGRYYGKIANFKDDIVYLRLDRSRATKRIAYDTIEEINIVGF